MKYTIRPLVDRHWLRSKDRLVSRFTATWTDTLELLEREVFALHRAGQPDPVVMVDATEGDLRRDGQLRANARLASPAVALAFESIRGPLTFRCDRYSAGSYGSRMEPWQHNVRAIALTLEALRAVDRYGATSSGEQYKGYLALEAGPTAMPAAPTRSMTREQAVDFLVQLVDPNGEWSHLREALGRGPDNDSFTIFTRAALRRSHPDTGGSAETFQQVQDSIRVLTASGRPDRLTWVPGSAPAGGGGR